MNDIDLSLHEEYSYGQVNEIASLLLTADEEMHENGEWDRPHADQLTRFHGIGRLVNAADEIRHESGVNDLTLHVTGDPNVSNAVTFSCPKLPDYVRDEIHSDHGNLELRHVDPKNDYPIMEFTIAVDKGF